MADNENIFNRLEKLFRSNIIVKRTPSGQVRVKDVDMTQTALTSNFVDRYNKIMNSSNWAQSYAARQNRSAYDIARKELFRDYELMDTDSIISATLDIYSDESTVDNVENQLLKIKTDNPKIHAILDNLFNGILNIKFNLWSWIRNMTKYGDFYLQLDILDKTGVVNVRPISAYEINRLEDHDPSNPQLVQFEIEQPSSGNNKTAELLEEYEVAHFRMLSDSNYLPYGKSMLEGARKVWKQLTLMEDAMLIHRIMRAPEKRIFKIDIGNIPPSEVENYMNKIIGKMKKIPVIDQKTGEYNLRYNVESVTEDYYLPVRGADSGTEIDTLPGLSNDTAIDDVEYLRNRMMAALKVPKAFLGYEEGIGCVVPETEIPLLNGEIKTVKDIIEDYENGIKHYTYAIDSKTNMIVPGEIEWAGYTKKDAELVRVNLDNDKYIDCTPDHRFLTRNGVWVEAQDLEENQSLMPLYLDETTQKNKNGYTTVYHPETGKYQEVHRLVAEYYDMVEAGSGKVVHHRDFQKKNNYPENFDCSMDYYEHRNYHSKLIEKTLNSPENMARRVKEQKKNNHFEIAGRRGGLKSSDKLVKWLKENGPWNKGKLSGETKKCVECKEEFY
nr:portal protein [Candidatus Pelagibacter sp.]